MVVDFVWWFFISFVVFGLCLGALCQRYSFRSVHVDGATWTWRGDVQRSDKVTVTNQANHAMNR